MQRAVRIATSVVTAGLLASACSNGGHRDAAVKCGLRAVAASSEESQPADSDFPPADAKAPAGTHPMTAQQAIHLALDYGVSNGGRPSASAATATEMTYGRAEAQTGGDPDARVSLNRCVWKVDVNATYNGFPGPPPHVNVPTPATVAQAPSYSVIYDTNSGFMFEIDSQR